MRKKTKNGRRLMKTLCGLIVLIGAVIIFFRLPFSKEKSKWRRLIKEKMSQPVEKQEVFTETDIKDLPLPVQKHFRYCDYLGTPKMSYMRANLNDVNFKLSENKMIKIDYTQYNFVNKPERFAFISSSLYGIPFEGVDTYQEGVGSMRGILAKVMPLFDQRGTSMDRAALVTILAESLFIPNVALQDYINWEELNETQARAKISYGDISASGMFTFDEKGALRSFRTGDRTAIDMEGNERKVEWSAVMKDYQEENGLKQPKVIQSIWHFPEGDSIYFNENEAEVIFEYF